ncbi:MAG: DMT family transporter [Rhodospirillaceae bacterium]|nr:DMT family transporter [Rhodospirillaceae bacterium]MBT5456979.1 DMT family transporter [Rhodospirillaceae bacterium]
MPITPLSLRQAYHKRLAALSPTARGAYWMLISACGYSASIAIVHHLVERLPVFEIALARNVFGLVFMLPWLTKVGLGAMRTSHMGKHAIRGVLSASNVWFLFAALAYAPVADVSAITFLMPIIASVLAVFVLKEQTSLIRWAAALTGFAGALIVIRPGMAEFNPGILFAVGAVCAGSLIAMLIKTLLKYDSGDTVAAWLFISHIVLGIVPAILVWITPNWEEVLWMVLLGWLGAVIQRTFNRSMAEADASVVLPYNFTRLIWAALFGFLFFAEIPDIWTWVGGSVIFISSIWLTRINARRNKEEN